MNGEPGTQNGARIAGIRIQRTACAKFIEVRRKAPSGVRQHLKKRTQFAGVAGARACQPSSFHCFPDFLNRRSSSLSPERFEIWSAPMPDIAQTRRQLGFAVWTAATPITGAPAAYCFHIHHTEPRGLHGLVTRYAIGAIRFLRLETTTRVPKRRSGGRANRV